MSQVVVSRHLSTFAIAEMLKVDPGSVANWIDQGFLKAHRTPGRHRRVASADLVKFLREQNIPVPPEMGLGPTPTRILVIGLPLDAQAIHRSIVAKHSDYEVVEAHDGFQAGQAMATTHPDAIILDLDVQGMDGIEVCRLIKSRRANHDRPQVVALTSQPSLDLGQKILQAGAYICLQKPLNYDQLLRELYACLHYVPATPAANHATV
jgi:excisionase family DNA binding protein